VAIAKVRKIHEAKVAAEVRKIHEAKVAEREILHRDALRSPAVPRRSPSSMRSSRRTASALRATRTARPPRSGTARPDPGRPTATCRCGRQGLG
jgi:hypothetical protein